MTNEEAIEELMYLKHMVREDSNADMALDIAIEALNQNQWIPCESITEPIDREVLCCDKNGEELIGWLDYDDSYECWVCASDDCVMYDTVAYMEKPKPYEGRTE